MSAAGDVLAGAKRASVGFWGGVTYPFRGFGYVYFKRPGLVRYWIWPVLLTMGIVGIFLYEIWSVAPDALDAMLGVGQAPSGSVIEKTVDALRRAISLAVTIAMTLGALLLVALVVPVLAAPFNDALSEEVERLETGKEPLPFSLKRLLVELGRTLRIEGAKLLFYVCVMLPLFVLSLALPGVGQAIYVVFGVAFTTMYYAIDYIDWPASRRGLGVRQRAALARAHLPVMLGFGLSVWLMLFLPFVNLFFIPAAVTGGTMLYLDLAKHGSVPA